ncbi:MAG: Hsp20/alpha crystallin family protein [Oscillospiraceae bacterium]|nr:Hsp20/alpha crystallin family protein [Oscillospiraceae bacterium]
MFGITRRNQDIYNPWREMEELEKAFFGGPMGRIFDAPAFAQFRTDVTDEGDHYLLETDLPGFEKKDITLDIRDDTLIVRAERKSKVEEKDKKDKVIRMERTYGAYQRSFDISGVDADKIRAKYTDGVLRLTLPKQEKRLPKGRRLEIE